MYCVKCGVQLAETEKRCPLCNTVVYHPDLKQEPVQPLYPAGRFPAGQPRSLSVPIILSTALVMPMLIALLCNLQINGQVTWSGFVIGALMLAYVVVVLPGWFRKPDPALLVFCDFVALNLYLLYINYAVEGIWFWGFGFPLTSAVGLVTTAVVLLMRFFPTKGFFIFGGACVLLGVYAPVLEYLINLTFERTRFAAWSLYPLVALVLLGLMLIFLGTNSAVREKLERKFFI